MNNFRSITVAVLLLASVAATAQTSSAPTPPKPIVWQEGLPVVPNTLGELWDMADVVVRVRLESQRPRYVGNGPQIVTEQRGVIVRVFKGSEKAGSSISFVQMAGQMELPDKIIRVDGPPPLPAKGEYIVFLKTWPAAGALNLVGNHSGAFRIERGGVRPEGFGVIADQHRDLPEGRFIDELERAGARHQQR